MKLDMKSTSSKMSSDPTSNSIDSGTSLLTQRAPQVSIIIPTFREADNLTTLCDRLFTALDAAQMNAELIIVDDNSGDGTEEIVAELALRHPIRLFVRAGERGLSSAVVYGFKQARAAVLVCMDADLSHPPESVPTLIEPVMSDKARFCVGSRYVAGAHIDEHWGFLRALNSHLATWLARPLTPLRDPMAGFFCTTRQVFEQAQQAGLKSLGYKIGLELVVRANVQETCEVAIQFDDRQAGASKLGIKQQLEYLAQLFFLYINRFPAAVIFFSIIICAIFAGIARFL